ncbi:MAG: ATP-binding protein [Parvibaculum sp.]|uniref:sensor histidine kinase n=1 Tax=Parvibaculum sp. TaxID=2024848 RepID=UPI00284E64B8|nr:ATP-binding protein [Parvibaculum sp.]MDR3499856.1 ATP-binding protein [Parvibaculum sp.]
MPTTTGPRYDALREQYSRWREALADRLRSWRPTRLVTSMQGKLVLTSLLVSVLPMILVAQITSSIIVGRFQNSLETWLLEVSSYFLSAVKESQVETSGIIDFIVSQPGWIDPSTNRLHISAPVRKLLKSLGYDAIAIVDENLNIVSSYPDDLSIKSVALSGVSNLYATTHDGHLTMMSGAIKREISGGKPISLFIGNWLDEDFMSAARAVSSIEIGLYYREDGVFRQVFSSHNMNTNRVLPTGILRRLEATHAPVLQQANGFGYGNVLYRGITTNNGETVAVLSTSMVKPTIIEGVIGRKSLFFGIFISGLLLSALVGVLVSRRLSAPMHNLAKATQRIALGDYAQVPVDGDDEVADLARAFNRMAEDLGKMHALEGELRRRERIAALGEISVGIAHEVRNPLGTIKTSAELVRRRGGLCEEDLMLIGHVIDEVGRIDALITDFLDFAKPRSPVMRNVRLSDIVTRIAQFFAPEFARRNIDIEIQDEIPGLETQADSDQVFQASINLVLNALDAMPMGGKLFIRTSREGNNARISFTDTGGGVEPDIQDKIFNPFFTTKATGTGLGLAKVFAIMRSHDGSVECHSEAGNGATFTLVFPIVDGGRS